jgi:hypothetical protein
MKKLLLAAVSISALIACNPEKEAVVLDTGDITGAGCGYLLVLPDSALLKPVHLDAAFRHHNLPVKVEYTYSGIKDTCDYGAKVFEMVTISKIKKDI